MSLVINNPPANAGNGKRSGSNPCVRKIPGEGMANHSNILAWRILETEEPSSPQSIGSQRVGHD